MARMAVVSLVGAGRRRKTARVTSPSVPSLPMNNCFKSYAALFFSIAFIDETIVPSANTASRPSTFSRVIP